MKRFTSPKMGVEIAWLRCKKITLHITLPSPHLLFSPNHSEIDYDLFRKYAEEAGIKLYFAKEYSGGEWDGIRWIRDGGD
jgi:hypothetical protein